MNDVSNPPRDRTGARRRAQNHFELAEARTKLVKQIVESENAARDAKTAKLRALRLAKEEADRAKTAASPKPQVRAARKRAS